MAPARREGMKVWSQTPTEKKPAASQANVTWASFLGPAQASQGCT